MGVRRRIGAEYDAAWNAFLRRRTAVFFTFFFPVLLVVIFGFLVRAQPAGGGLFTRSPDYYVPGYLAVVVLFTPLSRIGSEVARHRDGNRFEKLATTPLRRWEWLAGQTLVNVAVVEVASGLLLLFVVALTPATFTLSPLLPVFIAVAVALFCGIGALLGALADSQDGVIAASNAIALPMLFLAETFVPPSMLPGWMRPVVDLLPLTYFSRGVRETLTLGIGAGWTALLVLAALAVVFFVAGAAVLPRTD